MLNQLQNQTCQKSIAEVCAPQTWLQNTNMVETWKDIYIYLLACEHLSCFTNIINIFHFLPAINHNSFDISNIQNPWSLTRDTPSVCTCDRIRTPATWSILTTAKERLQAQSFISWKAVRHRHSSPKQADTHTLQVANKTLWPLEIAFPCHY